VRGSDRPIGRTDIIEIRYIRLLALGGTVASKKFGACDRDRRAQSVWPIGGGKRSPIERRRLGSRRTETVPDYSEQKTADGPVKRRLDRKDLVWTELKRHRVFRRPACRSAIWRAARHSYGMVVVPCSMKTLPGIRTGYADGLIARAADVTLKERRRLVLVPREIPLSEIHLENMLALTRLGARVVPPMPAFYNHPASIGDIVDHIVMRILDQFEIESTTAKRWDGVSTKKSSNLKLEKA
jgi:polyprenyl P-hydroxybenzoate/phenylacrylic acid decarboxylase-like protein